MRCCSPDAGCWLLHVLLGGLQPPLHGLVAAHTLAEGCSRPVITLPCCCSLLLLADLCIISDVCLSRRSQAPTFETLSAARAFHAGRQQEYLGDQGLEDVRDDTAARDGCLQSATLSPSAPPRTVEVRAAALRAACTRLSSHALSGVQMLTIMKE